MQDQLERRHGFVGIDLADDPTRHAWKEKAPIQAYIPRRRALENVPAAHRSMLGSNPQMFQTIDGEAYVQTGSNGTIRSHNLLGVPGLNRREKQRNARAVKAEARKVRLSKR